MNIRLDNKKALVCGSTQGIGLASAVELANNGANIVLMARNEEKLIEICSQLPNNGTQKHSYIVADFADMDNFSAAISYLDKDIDILINNTGGPQGGLISNAKTEEFINTFNSHLICNHLLVQHILPNMQAKKWGRVINIISTSVKQPLPNLGVSNTIRGAVASWAKTLATEQAAYGITVNNVLPGATATGRLNSIIENKANKSERSVDIVSQEMLAEIPMRRFAGAEEIANAVAFLASDSAAYITGHSLPVDGGRLLCL